MIGTEEATDAGLGTWLNGFTAGPQVKTSGATNEWRVSLGYRIVSNVGQFTGAKTVTNNPYWAASIATFKGTDLTPPMAYTITASAGSHGSISPSGSVSVNEGADQSFSITPDAGYQIADVLVDDVSAGAVSSYDFTNVIADHTISATFISTNPDEVIAGITGSIEAVDIPPSLDGGDFISQDYVRLMHEGVGMVTASLPPFLYDGAYHDPALPIVSGDDTFGNAITTPYSGPGLPPIGTEVYSVLLHFDPHVSSLPFDLTQGVAQSGTITFNRSILGVYVTSNALNITDNIFSPSGVTFSSSMGRDMEFNYDGDMYAISPDRHELSVTMFSHNWRSSG